jgi:hypothetical protein
MAVGLLFRMAFYCLFDSGCEHVLASLAHVYVSGWIDSDFDDTLIPQKKPFTH